MIKCIQFRIILRKILKYQNEVIVTSKKSRNMRKPHFDGRYYSTNGIRLPLHIKEKTRKQSKFLRDIGPGVSFVAQFYDLIDQTIGESQ